MADVVVDLGAEPWMASLAGLGSVHIHADGAIDVTVDDTVEEPTLRESALRDGWGEPLSLVRRGFRLLTGTALVAPDRPGCLVLTGSAGHPAMITAHLLAAGWRPLADGVVPVASSHDGTIDIDGAVVAHPRSAPLLLPRRWARKAGLDNTPVRADTDAVRVNVATATSPEPVVAAIHVRVRRPHDDVLRPLRGFEPFEKAAGMLITNPVLCPAASTPAGELANHARLAAVAQAEANIHPDTLDSDINDITRWWQGIGQS